MKMMQSITTFNFQVSDSNVIHKRNRESFALFIFGSDCIPYSEFEKSSISNVRKMSVQTICKIEIQFNDPL